MEESRSRKITPRFRDPVPIAKVLKAKTRFPSLSRSKFPTSTQPSISMNQSSFAMVEMLDQPKSVVVESVQDKTITVEEFTNSAIQLQPKKHRRRRNHKNY